MTFRFITLELVNLESDQLNYIRFKIEKSCDPRELTIRMDWHNSLCIGFSYLT